MNNKIVDVINLDFDDLEGSYSSKYKYLKRIDFSAYEDIDFLKTVFHRSLDHNLFILTLKSFQRMVQLMDSNQASELIVFVSDVFNIVSVESENNNEIVFAANIALDIENTFDLKKLVGNERGFISKSFVSISNRAFDELKDPVYLDFAIRVMEKFLSHRQNRNQSEERAIFEDKVELASMLIKNNQFLRARNILIDAIKFFKVQKRVGVYLETAKKLLRNIE